VDQIPLKQSWKQLCILHENRIDLSPWSLLLRQLLVLLKLGLITRILNSVGDGLNSSNRVRNRILLLTFLKLGLITQILNSIGDGLNSGSRVRNRILLLTLLKLGLITRILKSIDGPSNDNRVWSQMLLLK
jgi:hypothetical protein